MAAEKRSTACKRGMASFYNSLRYFAGYVKMEKVQFV